MSDASETWVGPTPPPLFSQQATDNAEVVPDDVPRGKDSMWSTATQVDTDEVLIDDEQGDAAPGSPWWGTGDTDRPAAPSSGGVFSADPVAREFDLLDVPVLDPDSEWTDADEVQRRETPLFTNGNHRDHHGEAEPASIWRDLDDDLVGEDETWAGSTPHDAPRSSRIDTADPNGFERAVERIDPAQREVAAVPLAVCGVLLEPGELVLGAVTGQMLGRPAAVVATNERVIVANDRRWQPLVDIFVIGTGLAVRGRHDREMAALSFTDHERLSMVDGIADVQLAIDLADAIRDPSRFD